LGFLITKRELLDLRTSRNCF